jgi:hypothetical protein
MRTRKQKRNITQYGQVYQEICKRICETNNKAGPSGLSDSFTGNFSKNFITKGLHVICHHNNYLIRPGILTAVTGM